MISSISFALSGSKLVVFAAAAVAWRCTQAKQEVTANSWVMDRPESYHNSGIVSDSGVSRERASVTHLSRAKAYFSTWRVSVAGIGEADVKSFA